MSKKNEIESKIENTLHDIYFLMGYISFPYGSREDVILYALENLKRELNEVKERLDKQWNNGK